MIRPEEGGMPYIADLEDEAELDVTAGECAG